VRGCTDAWPRREWQYRRSSTMRPRYMVMIRSLIVSTVGCMCDTNQHRQVSSWRKLDERSDLRTPDTSRAGKSDVGHHSAGRQGEREGDGTRWSGRGELPGQGYQPAGRQPDERNISSSTRSRRCAASRRGALERVGDDAGDGQPFGSKRFVGSWKSSRRSSRSRAPAAPGINLQSERQL